jgi:hypothetical protein
VKAWTWSDVWRRRLAQHWLTEPAPREHLLDVVGGVCGIHAQMAPSAELSLGLRVRQITRAHVRQALWEERTLVKTHGLRGTVHLYPRDELPLWLAALKTRARWRPPNQQELNALPPDRRDAVMRALEHVLDGRQLTREELGQQLEQRLGAWVAEAAFPAFGGQWPRWQMALHQAAVEGLIVFGPQRGNRVTWVRTDQWLGQLPEMDGEAAQREVCRRFLAAYGPATHVEFARWFYTSPRAAQELMRSMDLEEVDVEGWRAWLPAGDADRQPADDAPQVHLVPHFDCYVVGCFPRGQLIPQAAPAALQKGTAAPFPVVLIHGVVGGLWERRRRGNTLEIRVDTFTPLTNRQQQVVEQQTVRIGEILEAKAEIAFGPVEARGHL